MVQAVLLDQHLYLLRLLKRCLHLGEQDVFDYSQLLLGLVLLFAGVERVEGLEVLEEHVAKVYHVIFLVLRLTLSLAASPSFVNPKLCTQVTDD